MNDPVWHASGGKHTTDSLNSPDKKEKPVDLREVKPDLKMSAADFAAALNKNQDTLRDKVVDVTGVVDMYGIGELIVRSGPMKFPSGSGYVKLYCGEYPMNKAMPGQTATLRARWEPMIGLARWVIVRVEGDPPPTVTAEQLIADLKADAKGTETKFGEKYLVVTGTIRKLDKDNYSVDLTEPGATPSISCSLGALSWEAAEGSKFLEVGKSVRILGSASVFRGVSLSSGVILPPSP